MIIKVLACFVTSWHLQAFFAPQALDFLVINGPALDTQECGNLAIAITAILFGQANEGEPQGILIIIRSPGCIALGTAGLIEYLAGAAFTAPRRWRTWITVSRTCSGSTPCVLNNPGLPSRCFYPAQDPTRSCVNAHSLSPGTQRLTSVRPLLAYGLRYR